MQRCEKRCLEIEKRNPVLQLRAVQKLHAHRCCFNRGIRFTEGVAEILEDPNVVHDSKHTYSGHAGGLGGLVFGRFRDRPVVVLIEAKHDMSEQVTKTRSELLSSESYIRELRNFDYDAEDADPQIGADYRALRIDEYRDHEIMFAFGGLVFSDEAATRLAHIRTPWFRVMPDISAKKFVATLWGA